MNSKNAAAYIPLLEALRDEELQFNYGTSQAPEWKDADEVDFTFQPGRYRRKPKVRESMTLAEQGRFYACVRELLDCAGPRRSTSTDKDSAQNHRHISGDGEE